MNVIMDTSSDWLALVGQECSNCKGNKLDTSASSTAQYIGSQESERVYNDISVKGTEWLDSVCLSQSTCVDSFEFFLVRTAGSELP